MSKKARQGPQGLFGQSMEFGLSFYLFFSKSNESIKQEKGQVSWTGQLPRMNLDGTMLDAKISLKNG